MFEYRRSLRPNTYSYTIESIYRVRDPANKSKEYYFYIMNARVLNQKDEPEYSNSMTYGFTTEPVHELRYNEKAKRKEPFKLRTDPVYFFEWNRKEVAKLLEYGAMARLIAESELLITDSGGLQEEGMALHVPVMVLRNVTERPEGLEAGGLVLAGTEPEQIYATACNLLEHDAVRAKMSAARNPYGDGNASERVAAAIAWRLGIGAKPDDWDDESISRPLLT